MPGRTVNYAREAFDLIDKFDRLSNTQAVMAELGGALSRFGYSAFLITGVPEPPLRVESYFLMDRWPVGFGEEYQRQNYYADDPIAAWCRRSINPYEWEEAVHDPRKAPRSTAVMRLAEDFGMRKGFCVPIIRGNGLTECVTMAGERPDFEPHAKKAIHIISMFAHARAVQLLGIGSAVRSNRKILTIREAEVLVWIGRGKSAWEIGQILGVTERTVNHFTQRAMMKLKAVNRTQAVVNAIVCREIEIPG